MKTFLIFLLVFITFSEVHSSFLNYSFPKKKLDDDKRHRFFSLHLSDIKEDIEKLKVEHPDIMPDDKYDDEMNRLTEQQRKDVYRDLIYKSFEESATTTTKDKVVEWKKQFDTRVSEIEHAIKNRLHWPKWFKDMIHSISLNLKKGLSKFFNWIACPSSIKVIKFLIWFIFSFGFIGIGFGLSFCCPLAGIAFYLIGIFVFWFVVLPKISDAPKVY